MMPFSQDEYKNNLRNNAIAVTSIMAMENTGIVTVNTATAQNTTAGPTDTSNVKTFEENMTAAGVKPPTAGMANWTK